jgi:hypothetical protein
MKIRSNIKAGFSLNFTKIETNHNEKLADDNSRSIEQKKSISKKLRLGKETIRILKDSDLKQIASGEGATTTLVSIRVCNHNEKLASDKKIKNFTVKTGIKASPKIVITPQ